MKKIKFIVIVLFCVSYLQCGQAWKSLILPGWGELSLGSNKTGKNFIYAEAGLWLSFLVTNQFSSSYYNTYRNYAVDNAGVSWSGKNDIYAAHVGNYDSRLHYNNYVKWLVGPSFQEYDSNYDWNWCSGGQSTSGECIDVSDDNKRRKYDKWRYKSRNYEEIRDLSVAALIINRVISLFNVMRLQVPNKVTSEFRQYNENEFDLKIYYHF